jgi:shikimate dehydrogenase
MVRPISKDTALCMSLAGRPSNVGTRFHNFLHGARPDDQIRRASEFSRA